MDSFEVWYKANYSLDYEDWYKDGFGSISLLHWAVLHNPEAVEKWDDVKASTAAMSGFEVWFKKAHPRDYQRWLDTDKAMREEKVGMITLGNWVEVLCPDAIPEWNRAKRLHELDQFKAWLREDTPVQAQLTRPGFTIFCQKCGSLNVRVDKDVNIRSIIDMVPEVALKCYDCGHRSVIFNED